MNEKDKQKIIESAVKAFQAYVDLEELITDLEEDNPLLDMVNPEYFDFKSYIKGLKQARDFAEKAYNILKKSFDISMEISEKIEAL